MESRVFAGDIYPLPQEELDKLDYGTLDYSPYGNDLAMFRHNLSMSPERRLRKMLGMASFLAQGRAAMAKKLEERNSSARGL